MSPFSKKRMRNKQIKTEKAPFGNGHRVPSSSSRQGPLAVAPAISDPRLHSQETGSQAEACSAWATEGSPHLGRVNPGEPLAHLETNPVLWPREPSTSLLSLVICKMGPSDDVPYGAAVRFKRDHIIRARVASTVLPKSGARKVPEDCFTTHVPPPRIQRRHQGPMSPRQEGAPRWRLRGNHRPPQSKVLQPDVLGSLEVSPRRTQLGGHEPAPTQPRVRGGKETLGLSCWRQT